MAQLFTPFLNVTDKLPPSLWDNLDKLNAQALTGDRDTPIDPASVDDWPYRQEWFPGDHSTLGGGVEQPGLAAASFNWIAQGARKAGLDMRSEIVDPIVDSINVRTSIQGKQAGMMSGLLNLLSADRAGPDDPVTVSKTARARIACDATYRPRALDNVMHAVERDIEHAPLLPGD
jgi:uncharacterized protein (DUF2235 family)